MLLFCFLLFLSIAHHVNCVVSFFSSIDCIYSYIQLLAAIEFNKFSVSVSTCFVIFAAFKKSVTLNFVQRSFKVIHFGRNRTPVYDYII